jgi:hypothetical protein
MLNSFHKLCNVENVNAGKEILNDANFFIKILFDKK